MAVSYSTSNLEAFVDTVRLRTFSAVARRRGMTASSIARQVSALEQELGVSLFLRSTRSLTLTEAGRTLFERSERILDDLRRSKERSRLHAKDVRGLLRIGCWPTFGRKHILPHLPSLIERYPNLRIDLDLSERLHDPILERTDLIFRIGDLTDSTLIATRFATQRSVFAASPAYIAQHGLPRTIADCRQHRLIDKRHTASSWDGEFCWRKPRHLPSYVLQTDDLQVQADACAAGLGLVHLPDWVIYDHVQAKTVTLFSLETGKPAETTVISLLRTPGPPTAAAEAFCNHLRQKIGSPPIWEQIHQ